jgi:hypothetical protein
MSDYGAGWAVYGQSAEPFDPQQTARFHPCGKQFSECGTELQPLWNTIGPPSAAEIED